MPIIEGFLCKQGSGRGLFEFKTWKVRWCVIDYGHIKFYNSESQESELRKYSLSGAQLSSNVDAAEHDAPYECVFVIHFSSESQNLGSPPVVVLCVESLEEMQCWIDAIKIADASTQTTKITIDEPSTWLTNEEIQNLASMLSVDNFSPVFSFARIVNPSQLGPFFDHTSMILLHFSNMPHFIDICIDQLMSGQVLSTLFRENTVDLRFIAKYMFLVGKDFLKKVVEPHIHAAVQHPSLEVNPLKIQIEDSAASRSDEEKSMIQQSHCKNHHSKIMTITSALLASIDSAELPYSIVKVLHRIAVLVSRDFPDFMYAGVCNVFFLRFIVASLCTPHMFGLCTDIEFTPSQTRNLSIIAKVVQNIANGIVENKKEPFMQPLSSFIAEKQIFMAKFVSKVMGAGSSLSCDQAAMSLQSSTSTLCSLSKMNMQDLQLSSNWWIQFIHTHSTELPPALQMSISQSEFGSSSMRDSIRGQLANWSLIMEGKTVFSRPVLMSSLKPTIFSGDAFVVARFDCWCKLNRALMHGTLYATRSAFIFIACVFDSFDEIVVMQFTKIERITKLNIVDVEALVELDLNRPFFLDIQSAIRIDLNTDSGSVPVILFGITVGSDVAAPVDGTIDSSGKKSPSIFAAMYSLLSLSKARQEAASTSLSSDLPSTSTFRRVNSTSSSTSAAILSKSTAKSFIKRNSLTVAQQAIPQLQSLQDMLKAPHDEASAKGLSSGERIRLGSCRVHAQSLMHHINAQRNCYEINFTGTRVPARDPPILTRADWDAISPFICVMIYNTGECAEFPDSCTRYLLNVNSGSFAYCSGSKKNVEFFITRGNSLTFESDTAAHNFAQLYACEPRSSLIFLPIPLEAVPNAPEGLESRFFQFVISVTSSSFREMKRIERSLTSALQHHVSAANGEVSSDHPSKIDAPSATPASLETSSSRVTASSTICASVDRERMLQAVIQSRRSRKSQSLASQPEMDWNAHEDSD